MLTTSRRSPDRSQLRRSLLEMRQGQVTGISDLYDCLGEAVWKVCLLITGSPRDAERATIVAFQDAWEHPTSIPHDASGARRWMFQAAWRASKRAAS